MCSIRFIKDSPWIFPLTAVDVKPTRLPAAIRLKTTNHMRQTLDPANLIRQKGKLTSASKLIQKPGKVQRRDIPLEQSVPGEPIENNPGEKQAQKPGIAKGAFQLPAVDIPKLPTVKPLIKPNETEAERAERIHKSFERLLTFVEIVGQVDNYFSSKWKNLVRTVSNFYEVEDEPYRVSAKRIYGTCPHSH